VSGRDDRNGRGFGGPDRDRDEAFVRGVLGRTTGPACGRCLDRLPDLVDGKLEAVDRQLVQAHLEHCAGCRAVGVTLGWLTPLLPAMAEIDPGEDFTAAVLDATARRRIRESAGPAGAAGLMDRLGRWWGRRILEPHFAVQTAYAATIVLVLLTALPGAPLKGAPGKALEVIQAGPAALPGVGPGMVRATRWVEVRADRLVGGLHADADARWDRLVADWTARRTRTDEDRTELDRRLRAAAVRLGDGEVGEAGTELFAALGAGRSFWRNWWEEEADVGR